MVTAFDRSTSTALGTLLATAGRAVKYQRGEAWRSIAAARGRPQQTQAEIAAGLTAPGFVTTWTVLAADLVVGGETITPRPGDLILDGELRFSVAVDPAGRAYYPIDPAGEYVRIYSILTG